MLKNPTSEDMSINVFLKNGEEFLNRDVPQALFGEVEKVVCFWDNDKLGVYAMSQVSKIELVFNK